ncbi:retinoic acid-induced protein 1 [Pleurodeles waltl]|uniref:retinoic acid-induced protein 1 n=1 Tax=Pleurodeles waltl TaxID=8319 RepID=UPI0037095582
MQSFRERCGFHSNQQNFQTPSQEPARLENYRHQSQPGLNCERQRLLAKDYYNQQSFPGYENSAVDKYHRGNKQVPGQQLQVRPTFPAYAGVQENSAYQAQYSGEEGLQNWGSPQQALAAGVAKYEETMMKKTAVPADGRPYQEQAAQLPFQAHPLHLPQQQQQQQQAAVAYSKLQRQKIQSDVSSFPQNTHFSQHSQSFPPSSTYSSVQGHSIHTYKSCSAPSTQQQERPLASANMATGQRVQALHGFQPNRISYEQQQSLQGRHHAQETLHYQNLSKYQHYNQQSQTYCQSDTPVRTPDQYYQTFSPNSNHSPARSVGRSPSYSSTPSPLMPNLENFQYNQQSLNTGAFQAAITDHSHYMPLLNPSPTDTSSPDHSTGKCKNLQKDKLADNILSDLSLQSLSALTSQVENISNTVQQLLLSKSGMPQKKSIKNPARTPEQRKGQHCSPENNTYSMDQMGTPVSDTLGTPQSAHNEAQDTDYLSGSEDPLERGYLFCDPSRSPARAKHNKMKPESLSTCSVTSPDNMSVKSDDSFQSINATLPLDTFAKYVSSDGDCPRLLMSQDELSSEIIALQDAINSEKTDKDWEMKLQTCNVRSATVGERYKIVEPCMKNSMKEIDAAKPSKEPSKSPFNLENNRTCMDPTTKGTWPNPEDSSALNETLKLNKNAVRNTCTDFGIEKFESTRADYSTAESKKTHPVGNTLAYNSNNIIPSATSSASYSCYSNSVANCVSNSMPSSMPTKSTETFGWLDKSINESCQRWKELEMSLNSSDPEKDLFQSKLIMPDKEQESACPDKQQTHKNKCGEKLNKKNEITEEEEEAMRFLNDTKADTERWLEDARNCSADSEFQDISLIGSPDVKVSDLEQGEYSPLCDISSPERKSMMEDAASLRSTEKAPVVASEESPESTIEHVATDANKNPVRTPHLTSQSVMLLGPVIGTESKVKSWFGSSLPHIEDEEEVNTDEGADKQADTVVSDESLAQELNSQIVPESILKMNIEDLSKNRGHHSTEVLAHRLEVSKSKEITEDQSANIHMFVNVPTQSTALGCETQSLSKLVHITTPEEKVNQETNAHAPPEHITYIQDPNESLSQTVTIQVPLKNVDRQVHIQIGKEHVDEKHKQTIDSIVPLKSMSQSTHTWTSIKTPLKTTEIGTSSEKSCQTSVKNSVTTNSENMLQTTDVLTPIKSDNQLAELQTSMENVAQTGHTQAGVKSKQKMVNIQGPTENVDETILIPPSKIGEQTADLPSPMKNLQQTDDIQAPIEHAHPTGNCKSPLKLMHQTIATQASVEIVHQATDIQAVTKTVPQTSSVQVLMKSVPHTSHVQTPVDIKDKKAILQGSVESVGQTTNIQASQERFDQSETQERVRKSVQQTSYLHAPMDDVIPKVSHSTPEGKLHHKDVLQEPMKRAAQINKLTDPTDSTDKCRKLQAAVENEHQIDSQQVYMESDHQLDDLHGKIESVHQIDSVQSTVETIDQTTSIHIPSESVHETDNLQAVTKSMDQTVSSQTPTEIVDQITDIQASVECVVKMVPIQAAKESVEQMMLVPSPVESIDNSLHVQAPSLSVIDPPVRMCTRSFTAMAEPREVEHNEGKRVKRGARGLKRKAVLQNEWQDVAPLQEAHQTSGNDFLAVSPQQGGDSFIQKAKDNDDQHLTSRNQRSMILRSRTKVQDLFHMKRRHGKRATEVMLKNCKVAKRLGANRRLPSNVFKLACHGAEKMEEGSKVPKIPKSNISGKATKRALLSLKRKSTLISPIPANKRNLMLRRNTKQQKQGPPPRLFKKSPLLQRENKLPTAALKNASVKGPRAGLRIPSRVGRPGGQKTKVLPPRKGRGLKLESIVQKIASPHLKKLPGTAAAAASSAHDDPLSLSPSDRALRNTSACSAAGDAGRASGGQAPAQRSPAAEQLCRNANRPLKGKPGPAKRLFPESSEGEACSSPEAGFSMGIRSMATESPGTRSRKGRPAAGRGLAADSQPPPACRSPSAARPPDKMERPKPEAQDSSDEEDEETEGKLSQGRGRKRASHATFNGYSKRQRKGLSAGKAKKSKAKSRKSRAKRRRRQAQAPIVAPTEPEIRLKYLSCKPLQRGEGRVKPFAPYVQVERKDAFSTVCTVINSLAEELTLHQVECSTLTGTASTTGAVRPALPCSSAMKLGPIVTKALPVSCLLCCLCRNPSNHKDLGDLCGPYYPEDYLPKKKTRLKEKITKAEVLGELPLLPPSRTPRANESSYLASIAGKQTELDGVATDPAKQTLRSSTRGLCRKLHNCYCCDKRAEGDEPEKSRRHQCSKAPVSSPSQDLAPEMQEHWVHEACVIWTRGVYLVGGKLYGLQEASDMAAKVVCPGCQQAGASITCCHKGCAQTYHFTCAIDAGCLLNEDNFSLRCLKHKRQYL